MNIEDFDKIIKEKLEHFEDVPPAHLWNAIEAKVGAPLIPSQKPFYKQNWFIFSSVAAVLLIVILFVFKPEKKSILPIEKQTTTSQSSKLIQTPDNSNLLNNIQNNTKNSTSIVQPTEPVKKAEMADNNQESNTDRKVTIKTQTTNQSVISIVEEKVSIEKEPQLSNIPDPRLAITEHPIKEKVNLDQIIEIKPIQNVQEEPVKLNDEKKPEEVIINPVVTEQNQNPVNQPDSLANIVNNTPFPNVTPGSMFYLGLTAGPDIIFRTTTSNLTKQSYSADVRFGWQTGTLGLQAGFGVESSQDRWNYKVLYKQNEYVGSYQKVDSVWFSIVYDSLGNPKYIPHFVTSVKEVWDSVEHIKYDLVNNSYIYFHFPLLFTYKLYDFKRISFLLSAGPVFSIVSKQYESSFSLGNQVRIIKVENGKLHRYNSNWQIFAALNARYRLNNRWFISVDPMLRYYSATLYQSSTIKQKPYSLGMRAGLYYNF